MPACPFRSELGAAELRRLARHASGRVCRRVLLIANMLAGMENEEAAQLCGLRRSAAYEWHNRYEEEDIERLRDRPRPARQPRVDAVTSARFNEPDYPLAPSRRRVVAFRGVDAQRILFFTNLAEIMDALRDGLEPVHHQHGLIARAARSPGLRLLLLCRS